MGGFMDVLEKNIKTDLNNILNKLRKNKSKSTYIYNLMDLSSIYELCNLFYIDYYEYDLLDYKKINDFNRNDFYENYKLFQENSNFINITSKNTYNFLNNYNFMPINAKKTLTQKEIIDITTDFLNYYSKPILAAFKDLSQKGKIIYYNNLDEYGVTYSSKNNNFEPYVIINRENTLMDCVTLVHEITHAYYFYHRILLKNSEEIKLCNSAIHEIPTYTSELFLYKWLFENRIYVDEIKFLYNDFFYTFLKFATYFQDLFDIKKNYSKKDFENIETTYIYSLNTFIVKIFAIYFESFKNIEQVNNIINNIYSNHTIMNFENLIKDNNLDLKNITNFFNGKRLIKKLYDNGGFYE